VVAPGERRGNRRAHGDSFPVIGTDALVEVLFAQLIVDIGAPSGSVRQRPWHTCGRCAVPLVRIAERSPDSITDIPHP
jgi:hypothetical protein